MIARGILTDPDWPQWFDHFNDSKDTLNWLQNVANARPLDRLARPDDQERRERARAIIPELEAASKAFFEGLAKRRLHGRQ